ncbi:hypothetical protein VI817_009907 [Penicillium citrinum]|nr:hypothetical protein VI817_009907 [Penicillium citrinum]
MSRRDSRRHRPDAERHRPDAEDDYYRPDTEFRGRPVAGTGAVLPTKFWPQRADDEPMTIFQPRQFCLGSNYVFRHTHIHMSNQLLILTDGSCSNNGIPDARGGCSFIYGPQLESDGNYARKHFRLENKGPFGEPYPQTSNRAELRAVIAALRYRNWARENFNSIVVATDSEYVSDGVTKWIRRWLHNGWRTRSGPVENIDLWQCLLGDVERLWDSAIQVLFWRIPRNLNQDADGLARTATHLPEQHDFVDHVDYSF